ncbi:MAG: hypothetical protein ACYC2U_00095 [Candidatus Amoebophilus sp.]
MLDINIRIDRFENRPLHWDVEQGNLRAAKFLLESGANIYARNDLNYESPLHKKREEYDYYIVLAHANTTSGSNYQKIESLI